MKKIAAIVMTILLVLCLFSACDKAEQETISYKVFAPDGAPAMAVAKMMKDGENVSENREFSYDILGGANQADLIKSAMINEEADFIIAPTNLGVKLALTQGKYLLAATTSWGNLCLVTNGDLKTFDECENIDEFMAQLSGKTVESIGTGAVPDVSFKYLLEQNEITDCTVAASSLEAIQSDLLASDTILLGIVGEPAATATVKKVAGTKIICNISDLWSATTGLDFPQASLFVKKTIAQNDKATVEAFLTKLQASITYLNQSADNALELGTYMENTGKSSLKGAIVKLSYVGMKQSYVSAQDAKDSVIRFVNVLGVQYDENSADVFYK